MRFSKVVHIYKHTAGISRSAKKYCIKHCGKNYKHCLKFNKTMATRKSESASAALAYNGQVFWHA
jgi:hypothetical protein